MLYICKQKDSVNAIELRPRGVIEKERLELHSSTILPIFELVKKKV